MSASKVERFPVSHWKAHERGKWRDKLPADSLTTVPAQIAAAAWLVALTDEVVSLGGSRQAMHGAARDIMETLGVDPDHGGAAEVLKQLSG